MLMVKYQHLIKWFYRQISGHRVVFTLPQHACICMHAHMHARMHTHPFYGPQLCPGLPKWASTRTSLDLLRQETVSGSGVSWTICKSAPRPRQITCQHHITQFFTDQMPFLPPNQQHQSTEDKYYLNTSSLNTVLPLKRRCEERALCQQRIADYCGTCWLLCLAISDFGQLILAEDVHPPVQKSTSFGSLCIYSVQHCWFCINFYA